MNYIDHSNNQEFDIISDNKKNRVYNMYDLFLFILIASLFFGYFEYRMLTPTRLIEMMLLPVVVRLFVKESVEFLRPFLLFFSFWFFYIVLSFLWVPDMNYALPDTFYFVMNSLLFIEILILAKCARSPLKTIAYAWMFAFFVTSLIAVRELLYDVHLSNARVEDTIRTNDMGQSIDFIYAAATFYNYNTYCMFICFCFLFMIYMLSRDFGVLKTIVCVTQMLLSVFILAINGSRGAIISVAIIFTVFLYYGLRSNAKGAKLLVFSILLLLGLVFIIYGDVLWEVIMFRLETKDMFEDNARIELWMSSLDLFFESGGIGTGVGSMIPLLQVSRTTTLGIYYCHSMFLELLMEYGVIIFLCFIGFLWKLFRRAYYTIDYSRKIILFAFLLSMPTYSVINSEYVAKTFVWCFFASIFVFSSKEYCYNGEII